MSELKMLLNQAPGRCSAPLSPISLSTGGCLVSYSRCSFPTGLCSQVLDLYKLEKVQRYIWSQFYICPLILFWSEPESQIQTPLYFVVQPLPCFFIRVPSCYSSFAASMWGGWGRQWNTLCYSIISMGMLQHSLAFSSDQGGISQSLNKCGAHVSVCWFRINWVWTEPMLFGRGWPRCYLPSHASC